MRGIGLVFILFLFSTLSGCSLFSSGSGSKLDGTHGMGDGNIPLAGSEGALSDIHFNYDSASLSRESRDKLGRNAEWLKSNSDQKVVVEGHCDERGTAEYNLALGERRAQSVQRYLQSLGVKAEQLSTVTYGEEIPLDPSRNESAFSKNRRVHFAFRR